MDFNIVLGLPEVFRDCGVWHGSFSNHPTRAIWLYLPKDAIVDGLVLSISMYTGEICVESIMEWAFNALNHDFIHIVCGEMNENSKFDPICGLGPEGI